MPKHKKEKHFTVNLENKYTLLMKFGQFINITKTKILSKNSAKTAT